MLGSNVPTIGGLIKGFKAAKEWNCECIQVYLTLSRRWDVSEITNEYIEEFKEEYEKSAVNEVVAHIPFLVNLASPDKELQEKSINRLKIEILRAEQLGVKNLVLHPGSYTESNRIQGINRIIHGLNDVFNEFNGNSTPSVLLETMAGQGTSIGGKFDELFKIIRGVKKNRFLGVCLDTCHIYAAGYNIKTKSGYNSVLKEFDSLIGLEKIKAIHLNDSIYGLNSKKDRHCSIGDGSIGRPLFQTIVNDVRFKRIPKILEIPKRDTESKNNLDLLRSFQKI